MIQTPTVFILGAGVSVPLGFPSGLGLIKDIDSSHHPTERNRQRELLVRSSGYSHEQIDEFVRKLRGAGTSIDNWLESSADYLKLGKQAITISICSAEAKYKKSAINLEEDWYWWLWREMKTPKIEDLLKNDVCFVTFNYDRMLEYSLEGFLENNYVGTYDVKKVEILKQLVARIHHVHGMLSVHKPHQTFAESFGQIDLSKEFDGEAGVESAVMRVKYMADGIKVISESKFEEKELSEIRKKIEGTAKKVILGFGYDERNLSLLRINDLFPNPPSDFDDIYKSPVIGSAYAIGTARRKKIKRVMQERVALDPRGYSNVQFCDEYIDWT